MSFAVSIKTEAIKKLQKIYLNVILLNSEIFGA